MPKLNQIIAVCAGKKSHAASAITALYHTAQKEALFCGLSKSYRPKDEEGERLPGESQKVQATVGSLVADFRSTLTELWDVVATQELSNTTAKADIVVDGATVLRDVPVTMLLFLEKLKRLLPCMTLKTRTHCILLKDTRRSFGVQMKNCTTIEHMAKRIKYLAVKYFTIKNTILITYTQ